MIAKRGSGKSWVVRAILQFFSKKVPVGIIISPTDRMSSFYSKFIPDTYIYYTFQSETIERMLNRQKDIIKRQKERQKDGKDTNTRTFIVMDDCLSSKGDWAKDPAISELLFNGRHYHIMYILTMQFPLGITPELRSNFDYIFLLAEDYISNQKRIYMHYAGMFPDFDSFRQVFMSLTDDFGAMVIVNKGARGSALEKIFWYKSPNLETSQEEFGCEQFRQFHEKNYDPEWKTKAKGLDFNQFCVNKKKNKSIINIEKEEIDDDGNVIDQHKKSTRNYEKKFN
jgi:hypothetical protein